MHTANEPTDQLDQVFTVRMWREPSEDGENDHNWRGRLKHRNTGASRDFVGLKSLFEIVREIAGSSVVGGNITES